jgi:tripartite-type tricarboxylate transporter receptor subunit TctC
MTILKFQSKNIQIFQHKSLCAKQKLLTGVKKWSTLLILGLCGFQVFAQTNNLPFPNKPIKFIVPITPGGSNDVVARVIAQKLSDLWGQAVVVENRPGAGMNLGADMVAKSAPDGYTWLLGANNIFVTNPHVGKMPFDVFKDFTPVAQVATVPFVLVTHPSVAAKNVAGLVEFAKKNPGLLNYGSSGNGSPQQLATEMLNYAAGIQTQHVPYKGAVPAITDLLGGRIQIFIGAVNSLLPYIKDGKLKLLAGAGSKRFAAFPDLPAIAESIPGVAVDVWLGVFMPAGVPKEIINKVSLDMSKVLQQNDVKLNLSNQGIEVSIAGPEALTTTIREDYARWGKVIADANIKGE